MSIIKTSWDQLKSWTTDLLFPSRKFEKFDACFKKLLEKKENFEMGLTEDDLRGYREAFDLFDTDKGGTLGVQEIVDIFKALGFGDLESKHNTSDFFNLAGANENEDIDFERFVETLLKKKSDPTLM